MWNAFKLIDVSSCLVVCLSIVIHFKSENDGQSREGKIVANFMMPDLYLFFFENSVNNHKIIGWLE